MPITAGEYRAGQVSTLRAIVHRIRTDSAYGEDLRRLFEDASDEDPHGDVGATIRGLYRDWSRDRKLPTELVQRTAEATVRALFAANSVSALSCAIRSSSVRGWCRRSVMESIPLSN